MAQQISDEVLRSPGAQAGEQWGQQFNTGIQQLLHHKQTQMNRERNSKVFEQLGVNPAIAHLPENVQGEVLKHQLAILPQKQMEAQRKEQQIAQKETLPFFTQTYKEAQSADSNEKRLNKMEELIKKGKLSNPLFASGIKFAGKLGADLGSLMNADSQQFDKLSTDFVRDAKAIFGSRLTDADLNAFLKTVPTLTQSNEAKVRLIDSLRQINQAAKIKYNATKEIIKSNGGKRPANLETLVQEYAQPQLDAIAQNFKSNFNDVPRDEEALDSIFGRGPI